MREFSQSQIFIIFWIIGIIIGIAYDIFRSIRKNFKISDFSTNLQDLIFGIISGTLIIKSLVIVNKGQIRIYIIMAVVIGMIIYFLSLSKILILFLSCLLKIIVYPVHLVKILRKNKGFRTFL